MPDPNRFVGGIKEALKPGGVAVIEAPYVRDLIADQRPDGAIPHVVPDPTRNHEDEIPGFYGSTGWGEAICVIPWTP